MEAFEACADNDTPADIVIPADSAVLPKNNN